MAQPTASEHDAPSAAFRRQLAYCTLSGVCGRDFVRVHKLVTWLKSPSLGDTGQDWVGHLLNAAYRGWMQPGLPVTAQRLKSEADPCLVVFSILLDLDSADWIHQFSEKDICDGRLPIDLYTLRNLVNGMNGSSGQKDALATRFNAKQWSFCAPRLDFEMGKDFTKNTIMPFHQKARLKEGGTAQLWQVEVLEEFVGTDLREKVATSKFDSAQDDLGPRYSFALKTFKNNNKALYESEKGAFNALRGHEGMIQYLGYYAGEEGSPETVSTCNILLEFGEFDLEVCFFTRLPPTLPTEIEEFWRSLFGVADALRKMHNFKQGKDEYHGWHADIKPDNILSVEGLFKLADPGFAAFKKKGLGVPMPKSTVLGGTETFGAPELLGRDQEGNLSEVHQTIDIWSLGCVFSLAATWIVLGSQGILQYNKVRKAAIQRRVEMARGQKLHVPTTAAALASNHLTAHVSPVPIPRAQTDRHNLFESDLFHDGKTVLDEVRRWHDLLRGTLRICDPTTALVLDVIDNDMLLPAPTDRINAENLWKTLEDVMRQSRSKPRMQVDATIMKTLLDVDSAAPTQTKPSAIIPNTEHTATSIPTTREAQRSKLLNTPLMKTMHRSHRYSSQKLATNDGAFNAKGNGESPQIGSSSFRPASHTIYARTQGGDVASLTPTAFRDSIATTIVSSESKTRRSDPQRSADRGNVHSRARRSNTARLSVSEARSAQDRSRSKSSLFARLKPKKDQVLSLHYNNRDLVSSLNVITALVRV